MDNVLSTFFNISINGIYLDRQRFECISSIDLETRCDGSDTLTLKIGDPDFLFIEDSIFIEDAEILMTMGWSGETHYISFAGYISAIDIDFPDTGFPFLVITCLDKTHLMNRSKKKRSWDKVTNADVIKKIAAEYGFKCVCDSSYTYKVEDTISQSNSTDIEFCESLSDKEREPFMCKLIGGTLYYLRKGMLKEPSATLCYKGIPYDIVSFSPKITKETKQESVKVSNISTESKKVESATATSSTQRETQGKAVETTSNPVQYYTYDPSTKQWR